MSKKISAIVCTCNRYDLLPKALASLLRQSMSPDEFEILVIDNSTPTPETESERAALRQRTDIRYHLETVQGLSHARNVGIAMAESPVVAYMDDDAMADPFWLEEIVHAFATMGAEVATVGGLVEPIWEMPRPDWVSAHVLGFFSILDYGPGIVDIDETKYLCGTNIAFRRDVLRQSGGFPTNLGRMGNSAILLSNDETMVISRLRAMGYRAIYSPSIRMNHLVPASRLNQNWVRARQAWQAVSDCIAKPVPTRTSIADAEKRQQGFWARLLPRERNLNALFVDQPDAESFAAQMDALYTLTVRTLMGLPPASDITSNSDSDSKTATARSKAAAE